MKRSIDVIGFIFLALAPLVPAGRVTLADQAKTVVTISCTVVNDSAFQSSYELFDNVARMPIGSISLPPLGKTVITLQSSKALGDGYGSFRVRRSDSETWKKFDLIRNGQTRSLN
jgi:hypothetical protein